MSRWGHWCSSSGETFLEDRLGVFPYDEYEKPEGSQLYGRLVCPGCNRKVRLRRGLRHGWLMIPRHKEPNQRVRW